MIINNRFPGSSLSYTFASPEQLEIILEPTLLPPVTLVCSNDLSRYYKLIRQRTLGKKETGLNQSPISRCQSPGHDGRNISIGK